MNNKRDIISSLLGYFNQKTDFKIELINISPGNFLRFNYIIDKNKINFEENILINFKKFLNLYKKEKNPIYQDLLIFCFRLLYRNTQKRGSNKLSRNN